VQDRPHGEGLASSGRQRLGNQHQHRTVPPFGSPSPARAGGKSPPTGSGQGLVMPISPAGPRTVHHRWPAVAPEANPPRPQGDRAEGEHHRKQAAQTGGLPMRAASPGAGRAGDPDDRTEAGKEDDLSKAGRGPVHACRASSRQSPDAPCGRSQHGTRRGRCLRWRRHQCGRRPHRRSTRPAGHRGPRP